MDPPNTRLFPQASPSPAAGVMASEVLPATALLNSLKRSPLLSAGPFIRDQLYACAGVDQAPAHHRGVVGSGEGFVDYKQTLSRKGQISFECQRPHRLARRKCRSRRHGHGIVDDARSSQRDPTGDTQAACPNRTMLPRLAIRGGKAAVVNDCAARLNVGRGQTDHRGG